MTKITLACDPGLRSAGVSLFHGNELIRAGLPKNPNKTDRGPKVWMSQAQAVHDWCAGITPDIVVVETMMVYPGPRRGVDPADLLELQGVAGAVCALWPKASHYGFLAKTWKQSVPQKIFAERVYSKLTDAEKARYDACAPSLRHNIDHAVGLAQYFLKLGAA